MYRIGIDIGGTKIGVGLLLADAESAELLSRERLPTETGGDPIPEIAAAVHRVCRTAGIDLAEVGACGVGVPGTVRADGKAVLKCPNLHAVEGDFPDRLEKALAIPVFAVQDSRAAALGEYLSGAGKGAETLISFTLGTGIGTGILLGGRIYHGALRAAGEIGHLPVIPNGRSCGCGKRGCLEKYAAGGGLDISARELLGADATAHTLFSAARAGDARAAAVLSEAVERLGAAIVGAVNLLSPDCVLFSGGLSEEMDYLVPLIEFVRTHCYSAGGLPMIGRAALGALAPLYGAALFDPDRF